MLKVTGVLVTGVVNATLNRQLKRNLKNVLFNTHNYIHKSFVC